MAFWWVFQNTTYKEEKAGSYLWAPKRGKNNRTPFHWKTMEAVQPGDIIFSGYQQKIVAVSSALSKVYSFDKPFDINTENEWEADGNKIDVNFHELNTPLLMKELSENIKALLQVEYGPINNKGTGNQGYLFKISEQAGNSLLSEIEKKNNINIEQEFEDDIQVTHLEETTKESIVKSRIGQGIFRKNVLEHWNNQCAVTGANIAEILIASHIKPWKISNNLERIDHYNGLALSPTYDKLFDLGYISFNSDGSIIISTILSNYDRDRLKISMQDHLQKALTDKHKVYMQYHRENILK